MARYIQGKKIGSGTYSTVYEAVDTEENKVVALKKITLDEKEGMPSTALREIAILKVLNHPNIIDLKQIIHKEDFLIMVLEFVEYDLPKYLNKLAKSGNYAYKYNLIEQLIRGIAYINSNNIVHRDLKPANILINKKHCLKIADFGLARVVSSMDASYSSEVITLWYRPPELLQGMSMYSFEVDIWSLGCIIYEILAVEPLFPGENAEEMLKLIKSMNYSAIEHKLTTMHGVPSVFAKIVTRCLDPHPQCRITANEIILMLENTKKK